MLEAFAKMVGARGAGCVCVAAREEGEGERTRGLGADERLVRSLSWGGVGMRVGGRDWWVECIRVGVVVVIML